MNMLCSSLAARATFSQMFNTNKDIYAVIIEYVIYAIHEAGITFSANDITQIINDKFDFNIPEAVVKTSIKKFLLTENNKYNIFLKKQGYYSVIYNNTPNQFIICNESLNEITNNLLVPLFKYVEKSENIKLNEEEKKCIEDEFCKYLIEEPCFGKYTNHISAFIVATEHNSTVIKLIKDIKDGCILEMGLRYQGQASIVNLITRPLILFFDTEILFSANGLNGQLYKDLFDSFFKQVQEINNQILKAGHKNIIKCYFFDEQKREIDKYFGVAQKSVESGYYEPFPREAMKNIISQCSSGADVVALEGKFFLSLKKIGINQWNEDFDVQAENTFNLAYKENIDKYSTDLHIDENEVYSHLNILTKINILRKGINNVSTKDAGYLFLTGKYDRFQIGADLAKTLGKCYLISTLEWMTNYFWFRLNKGLGDEKPLTMNAVATAKRLLAANLDGVIGNLYQKFKKDNDSVEENLTIVAELRKKSYSSDTIDDSCISDVLDTLIHERDLNSIICEQEKKDKELEYYRKKERRNKYIVSVILMIIKFLSITIFCAYAAAWLSTLYIRHKEFISILLSPFLLIASIGSFITIIVFSYKRLISLFRHIFRIN